jgi:hypothetical protein
MFRIILTQRAPRLTVVVQIVEMFFAEHDFAMAAFDWQKVELITTF